MEAEKCKILVTGFGPFGKHNINASWEAVKELQRQTTELEKLYNFDLIIREIPVDYEYVIREIPRLWKEYEPLFAIHVGVSHKANCLTIESRAHNLGYDRPDICNKCPKECGTIELQNLETGINIYEICDNINKNSDNNKCLACVSVDAGRYLCEYTFYQSLCIQPSRTLFIHVPDFDVYSTTQVAKGLHEIIRFLITRHSKYSK